MSEKPNEKPSDIDETTLRGRVELQDVDPPVRQHRLDQVRGANSPSRFVLAAPRITIGRGPTCDIVIVTPSISRQHVALVRTGPEYTCEDCDSSNGVFLNGVRIQSAVLREGDRIQIGDIVFIYSERE